MSRNASLLELRTWARQLSDTENDPNVTDTELTALANRHTCEVWDRLVDAGPADYFATTTQITTVAGIIESPLPADFRNFVAAYVRESTDERRALLPMGNTARGRYKAPTGVWTLDMEYVPVPSDLVADGDTFDGISGFEELIANCMARDVMAKREADPSIIMTNIARLEARITSRSRSRDKSGGKSVTDMDDMIASPFPWGWTGSSRLACYRLRAGNLELYEALWGLP